MNINLLREKLLRAARENRPSDHVPLGFEQRVLAHIRAAPVMDDLALWIGALWRAAIPCTVIMLVFFAWATVLPEQASALGNSSLDTDLESTLMASVSLENDLSW